MKKGRPTRYNSGIAADIARLVSEGNSLSFVCRSLGVSKSAVYNWQQSHPGFKLVLKNAQTKKAAVIKEIIAARATSIRNQPSL